MNPALEGYAAAIFEQATGDARDRLAEELAAIERLVLEHPQLRASMADTAIRPQARRAVLDELLTDRVSDLARRSACFAARAVASPEVESALRWLASRASEQARHTDAEPLIQLGRSGARQRVGGYAAAIFEDSPTSELEEIEDALFRLARIIEATPPLKVTLTDRDVPAAARQGVMDELLQNKVASATKRLVEYVITAGRARDTIGTLDWLVEQAAAARGWRLARVRSARPLGDGLRQSLATALSQMTGGPVELQVTVEPALIGGAVVEIGDLQVDATARGRLDRLREHLVSGGWEASRLGSGE